MTAKAGKQHAEQTRYLQAVRSNRARSVRLKGALDGLVKRAPTIKRKFAVIDGIRFDSIHEKDCYLELKFRERAGEIKDLKLQQQFEFVINGYRVGSYKADFVYTENNKQVVADAKPQGGYRTSHFKMSKKLMKACFGVDIVEM